MVYETGVLVVVEIKDGRLMPTTRELLNVGRKLAGSLGQSVGAVLLGTDLGDASREAIAYGAAKVLLTENPLLGEGHLEAQLVALQQVCEQAKPNVVLIARTEAGRELGPRLAFRLGVGAAQDVVAISVDEKSEKLVIVAINKDPQANIFKEARYGVVGDWKKILPAFTQTVRELLA